MKTRTAPLALLVAASLSLLLAACSDGGIETDPTYGDKQKQDMYKYGSLASDQGGINIFGGDEKKARENGGIGVNGFLWRATLDTISFMPISSADPFGGLVITDWYSPPDTPNERTKLNVFIRGRDLTADGVKVSVFRQTRDDKGGWVDAAVAPTLSTSLEDAILTKARQIRIAQKQQQAQ
jgi:hypothetical protein